MVEPAGGGNAQGGGDALRQALEERNRLWERLARRSAAEEDAERLRRRLEEIERSGWWRAGEPLRLVQRALADPPSALHALAARVDALRKRRRR